MLGAWKASEEPLPDIRRNRHGSPELTDIWYHLGFSVYRCCEWMQVVGRFCGLGCRASEKPLPDMRRESMKDSLEREACLVPSRKSACAGAGK
jgi:hypothetical protein